MAQELLSRRGARIAALVAPELHTRGPVELHPASYLSIVVDVVDVVCVCRLIHQHNCVKHSISSHDNSDIWSFGLILFELITLQVRVVFRCV